MFNFTLVTFILAIIAYAWLWWFHFGLVIARLLTTKETS